MLMIVGLIFLFMIFYLLLIFPTQWLKVERVKHNMGLGVKILQISDIHMKNLRVSPEKVLRIIEQEKPDYIFITGDIVDRHEFELEKANQFLKVISKSGIETYAIYGNHDYFLPDVRKLEEILIHHQIRLMKNEWVEKEHFTLIGIDDCTYSHHNIESSFSFLSSGKKRIVITHNPEIVLYDEMKPFDYLISGHLHGKQINIPYLYHVKRMGSLAKKGIYKGKHTTEKGTIYISKGIGQTRINIRFFVRSEITIHEL